MSVTEASLRQHDTQLAKMRIGEKLDLTGIGFNIINTQRGGRTTPHRCGGKEVASVETGPGPLAPRLAPSPPPNHLPYLVEHFQRQPRPHPHAGKNQQAPRGVHFPGGRNASGGRHGDGPALPMPGPRPDGPDKRPARVLGGGEGMGRKSESRVGGRADMVKKDERRKR